MHTEIFQGRHFRRMLGLVALCVLGCGAVGCVPLEPRGPAFRGWRGSVAPMAGSITLPEPVRSFASSTDDLADVMRRAGDPTDEGWTAVDEDARVAIRAAWIPGLWIRADEDDSEPGLGLEFEADLDRGDGWLVAVQQLEADGTAFGFSYLTTEHTEEDTDSFARAHAVMFDASIASAADVRGPVVPYLEAGAGLGFAGIDFDGPIDDSFGAAVNGRLLVGFRVADLLEFTAGGGVFGWGYPGETVAYGAYFTIGGVLRF